MAREWPISLKPIPSNLPEFTDTVLNFCPYQSAQREASNTPFETMDAATSAAAADDVPVSPSEEAAAAGVEAPEAEEASATTGLIPKLYFKANAKSRSSCAGTPMTAPSP